VGPVERFLLRGRKKKKGQEMTKGTQENVGKQTRI
jgi:hypothetical protein